MLGVSNDRCHATEAPGVLHQGSPSPIVDVVDKFDKVGLRPNVFIYGVGCLILAWCIGEADRPRPGANCRHGTNLAWRLFQDAETKDAKTPRGFLGVSLRAPSVDTRIFKRKVERFRTVKGANDVEALHPDRFP